MSLSRRPGVPPSKPADAPVAYPGEAVPHLEALARTGMPVDLIVEEIERLCAGRPRFVDAALAAPQDWAPPPTSTGSPHNLPGSTHAL